MNDKERERWVLKEETLYNHWKDQKTTMRKFLRSNRSLIDSFIWSTTHRDSGQEALPLERRR